MINGTLGGPNADDPDGRHELRARQRPRQRGRRTGDTGPPGADQDHDALGGPQSAQRGGADPHRQPRQRRRRGRAPRRSRRALESTTTVRAGRACWRSPGSSRATGAPARREAALRLMGRRGDGPAGIGHYVTGRPGRKRRDMALYLDADMICLAERRGTSVSRRRRDDGWGPRSRRDRPRSSGSSSGTSRPRLPTGATDLDGRSDYGPSSPPMSRSAGCSPVRRTQVGRTGRVGWSAGRGVRPLLPQGVRRHRQPQRPRG